MHILIVEDDKTLALMYVLMLRGVAECSVAQSGMQALELFGQALGGPEPFDVVLMDMMLPDTDGCRALLEMRRLEMAAGVPPGSEFKALVLTGLEGGKCSMESFFHAGIEEYLYKPVEKKKLLEILQRLMIPDCVQRIPPESDEDEAMAG